MNSVAYIKTSPNNFGNLSKKVCGNMSEPIKFQS